MKKISVCLRRPLVHGGNIVAAVAGMSVANAAAYAKDATSICAKAEQATSVISDAASPAAFDVVAASEQQNAVEQAGAKGYARIDANHPMHKHDLDQYGDQYIVLICSGAATGGKFYSGDQSTLDRIIRTSNLRVLSESRSGQVEAITSTLSRSRYTPTPLAVVVAVDFEIQSVNRIAFIAE